MTQILQIFAKDLRHYWREGAVSIALLIAFARDVVQGWTEWMVYGAGGATGMAALFSLRFLLGLASALLPITWALLIVRVIQAESLVGDRQFWITRPYEWKKLLAAKILFVLVFLNLPWLIVDVFLLAKAGFSPAHYVLGLLWMQLSMTVVLILPVVTLATVTRSVSQLLLAFLAIVLYVIGIGWILSHIPDSGFLGPPGNLVGGVLIGACVAIVFLQYARRRTKTSGIVIGAAGLAFLLIFVATPYRAIVAHEFPALQARGQLPFQMALLPPETSHSQQLSQNGNEVAIWLPLSVSGVSPDSIIVIDGFLIDLTSPTGLSWNSGWMSSGIEMFPNTKDTRIPFMLKKKIFERMGSSPVKARIALAFTLFHDINRRSYVVPSGQFEMQDIGPCFSGAALTRAIQCLTPLRGPRSLLITTDLSENTCPLVENESPAHPGEIARGWSRNNDSAPAQFGISPVRTIQLFALGLYDPTRRSTGLCPGTPVVLSNPQPVRRNQTEIEVDSLRLRDYQPKSDSTFTSRGIGIGDR